MVNLCQTYTKQTQKVDTDMVDTQLQTKNPAPSNIIHHLFQPSVVYRTFKFIQIFNHPISLYIVTHGKGGYLPFFLSSRRSRVRVSSVPLSKAPFSRREFGVFSLLQKQRTRLINFYFKQLTAVKTAPILLPVEANSGRHKAQAISKISTKFIN